MNTIRRRLPLFIILIAFFALLLYLGHFKLYLYEDEVLSYTSANSETGMYIHLEKGAWYDKELVRRAVTAMPGECFDFGNTLKNSFADNHPPLHTLLLHAISSFFPGYFSKWFGLSINLAAGGLLLIAFYCLSLLLFDGRRTAAAASCLILTFSFGFTDTVLTIRNYTLLMLAVVLAVLLHMLFIRGRIKEKPFFIGLFFVTVGGMMCHYYYLTLAFYIASYCCLSFLIKKKYKLFGLYALTMLLAGAATLCLLPDLISDILFSNSGSGNFAMRGFSELIQRFGKTYVIINQDLFFGRLKIFLLCLTFYAIYYFYKRKKDSARSSQNPEVNTENTGSSKGVCLIFFVIICYYIVGSATLTYLATRYLSPIYPLIILGVTYFLDKVSGFFFKSRKAGLILCTFVFMLPMYDKISSGLVDNNKLLMTALAEENGNMDCVILSGFSIEENFFELEKYKGFCRLDLGGGTEDPRITEAKGLIVYIPNGKTTDECIDYFKKLNPSLKKAERLYKAYYSEAWKMTGD